MVRTLAAVSVAIATRAAARRRAVRVEANLRGTFDACAILVYSKCVARKCLTLKMKIKVTEYTIRNDSISFSLKVTLEHFRYLSPFSKYSHFKIRDLENVIQSHDVQHSQWHHAMANT